ncbi:MAG: hypothetical protein IMZ50_12670, partial [Candidatus Atribacteria bacterium]|nr:hypothetical protein [Candidatus Atribacteria bacterium]
MYAKVFAQIYDSSIAENYQVRHVFIDLLVLADPHGVVDMTPHAIARRTKTPLRVVLSALSALERPDPESRSSKRGGARITRLDDHRSWGWQIVNFTAYHNMRDENARREANRIYQQESRERKKACQRMSADVSTSSAESAPSAHADVDVDADADLKKQPCSAEPSEFADFWKAYPRKVGKGAARKAWKATTGKRPELPCLLAAVAKAKGSDQWVKEGGQFIPHPATWLNQERLSLIHIL